MDIAKFRSLYESVMAEAAGIDKNKFIKSLVYDLSENGFKKENFKGAEHNSVSYEIALPELPNSVMTPGEKKLKVVFSLSLHTNKSTLVNVSSEDYLRVGVNILLDGKNVAKFSDQEPSKIIILQKDVAKTPAPSKADTDWMMLTAAERDAKETQRQSKQALVDKGYLSSDAEIAKKKQQEDEILRIRKKLFEIGGACVHEFYTETKANLTNLMRGFRVSLV